ncbi:RELT-like protein 2 isoform X2 [Heterocephalus glaber]|uniref:RELT-like protein 2 isoform X2 n=1 Tax=Heterocephalus glaber TaxID=10181 RepID=A0AAX6TM41_HETGA|nr:RELT-like protein 2 isoform X2 [Heterocephalus glaber]
MVTHILILNLLDKDKRILGLGGMWGFWRLKEHAERTGGNRTGKKIKMFLFPSSLLSSVDATSSLQDGAPSHHHTVHLGSSAPCIHCSRSKRPPLVRQGRSKEGKSHPRAGETTVFSVGRFRVTHIEKRYGLHEHRDGSPTDRSWGSGGGQDLKGVQGSGGGQPRAGTPAIERLPPEELQPQALASPPVQNGGLRDSTLIPCAREGNPGISAESTLGARGRDPSPRLPSQRANEQPNKLDTSDHQVSPSQDAEGI